MDINRLTTSEPATDTGRRGPQISIDNDDVEVFASLLASISSTVRPQSTRDTSSPNLGSLKRKYTDFVTPPSTPIPMLMTPSETPQTQLPPLRHAIDFSSWALPYAPSSSPPSPPSSSSSESETGINSSPSHYSYSSSGYSSPACAPGSPTVPSTTYYYPPVPIMPVTMAVPSLTKEQLKLKKQKAMKSKRNLNACMDHKKKHQKCPLDCPRRKERERARAAMQSAISPQPTTVSVAVR